MKKATQPTTGISPTDLKRIESRLRRTLGCMTLAVDPPATRNASAQVRVGRDVVGTIDQVDEGGERFWAVTLVVLPEDLEE